MIYLILFYLFLVGLTGLIFRNAYVTFRKSRDYTFVISTLIIFYFTFAGAFIFPIDSYLGFSGESIGLHYFGIFERLFPVVFDFDYFLSCAYYGLFVLVFQYTYMYFVKSVGHQESARIDSDGLSCSIRINPTLVIGLSVGLIFLSAFLFRKEIYFALSNMRSVYLVTRGNSNPFYTIHQLANEFCVLIPFIAYTFTIVKSNKFNIRLPENSWVAPTLLLTCILSSFYISFLGNRREILSGIVICSLICFNHWGNLNRKRFIYLFSVVLVFFLANDFFRSPFIPIQVQQAFQLDSRKYAIEEKAASIPAVSSKTEAPTLPKQIAKTKQSLGLRVRKEIKDSLSVNQVAVSPSPPSTRSGFDLKGNIASLLFSNELFYAHFSMYGVIHYKLPLTYGSSFLSLAASIIPRFIYSNRPQNVYEYYAETVDAAPGQIYTIHHAAAYYLNFGILGLIIGGFVLACLFGFAMKLNGGIKSKYGTFFSLLCYLAPYLICAQLVTFITAGPEAYKSMILEGVVIPVVLLMLCSRKKEVE